MEEEEEDKAQQTFTPIPWPQQRISQFPTWLPPMPLSPLPALDDMDTAPLTWDELAPYEVSAPVVLPSSQSGTPDQPTEPSPQLDTFSDDGNVAGETMTRYVPGTKLVF